jgi:formyltetrahydrofolate synthetase
VHRCARGRRLYDARSITTVGLADGLRTLGKRSCLCIREPSLSPYFGIKDGGTGAGRSQAYPSEAINLHLRAQVHARVLQGVLDHLDQAEWRLL